MICDARLIYGRGWISRVFICCAALSVVVSVVGLISVDDIEQTDGEG